MQHPSSASPVSAAQAAPDVQLADIHLPASPGFWPPAWGWWLVLALALMLLVLLALKWRRYRQRKQRQQQVLEALKQLELRLQKEKNTAAIAELNILLRRLALMHYPRQRVASLTGQQWLQFLDESGQMQDFTQGAGQLLAAAPYQAGMPESADLDALVKAVRKWVKQMAVQSGRVMKKGGVVS